MTDNVHQSGTHSPVRDEALARLEYQEADPALDPQDAAGLEGGTPDGMSRTDIDLRTGIAQVLGTDAFPGDREQLVSVAAGNRAQDWVIDRLAALPPATRFQNVQDVARALGLGVEQHRN
jgi:hypothetical protein